MNCANCGHDIVQHATFRISEGSPCYGMSVACPDATHFGLPCETPARCRCENFVMPREEPKPKLCLCGHPATSHSPVYDEPSLGRGPLRLRGVCREGHEAQGRPCWGFTPTEDVKRRPEAPKKQVHGHDYCERCDNEATDAIALRTKERDSAREDARTWERRCGEERAEREKAERRLGAMYY